MSTVPFTRTRNTPLPTDLAKKLPSHIEAERSVLGAILLNDAALSTAMKCGLTPMCFFLAQHGEIYMSMLNLSAEKAPIDLLTLTDRLETAGKLELAGGAAYVASLCDGMPRVSNVEHYAKIVKEKARLREIIRLTHNVQQYAFDGVSSPDDLALQLETYSKQTLPDTENPAIVVGFRSILTRECAPIEYAIDPLISRRGTGEIYGWRGTGKSLFATEMAMGIATGAESLWGGHKGGGGHWTITRPFRQLYIYGEMDDSEIQQRMLMFARMRGTDIPTDEQLGTMCMDYQKGWRPKLSSARDRKFIEDRLFGGGYEGLWLDNLSTLWPASQDSQGERDAILADWYTDLNQRGIWVIWLHHAGKSGEQRGGSEKEDMLSFVLKLRRPANYKPQEQMRIEVHVEKNRHKCIVPKTLMPFEVQLTKNALAQPEWVTKPAQAAQRAAAFEMFKNQMPACLVYQDVGVSRATAYRWKKDFEENPNPDFHLEAEE